jgi:hypothetical protein
VIALLMVALAALVLVVELARHHRPVEAALLVGVLVPIVLAGRWLLGDLRAHPAGFPSPTRVKRVGGRRADGSAETALALVSVW